MFLTVFHERKGMPEEKLSFEIRTELPDRQGRVRFTALRDGKVIVHDTYKPGFADRREKTAKRWANDARLMDGKTVTVEEIADALVDIETGIMSEVQKHQDQIANDGDGEGEPEEVVTTSWADQKRIIELAFNRKREQPDFIVYDRRTKKVHRCAKITMKRRILIPPTAWYKIVTPGGTIPGSIFVPTEYDESGLDEEQLRCDVQAFIHRYVELPGDTEAMAVEYVFLSWTYDAFDELPYLALRTVDMGRGKSRGLETIGTLCYRPILCGGGSTAAAILRLVDTFGGTLLCDEFDIRDTDLTAAVSKIVNQGFQKNRPIVKCVGDDHEPKPF